MIKIREAKIDELDKISELDKEAFEGIAYPQFVLRQFRDICQGYFLVAETPEHDIAGYILGHLDSKSKTGWILALAVSANHRKLGIGKELTEELITHLKEMDTQKIKLTVHPDNNAIELYEKLGFVTVGREENYYGDNTPRLIMDYETNKTV